MPKRKIIPQYYRSSDLRELFGVTQNTVDRWVSAGKLPQPVKFTQTRSGVRFWKASEIDALIGVEGEAP